MKSHVHENSNPEQRLHQIPSAATRHPKEQGCLYLLQEIQVPKKGFERRFRRHTMQWMRMCSGVPFSQTSGYPSHFHRGYETMCKIWQLMPENIEGTQQHLQICLRTKSNLTRLTCTSISATTKFTTKFPHTPSHPTESAKTPRRARARTPTRYTFGCE